MKRILAAVDFSDLTRPTVREAARLARQSNARLWLLHAAPPDPEFVGYKPGPQSVRDQVARRFRREHRSLQAKARRLETQGISTTALLVQGPTVEVILRESARLKIQCLVMGSHGHGALYRTLMGSVCEGVLRKATCPVLVVPAIRGRN